MPKTEDKTPVALLQLCHGRAILLRRALEALDDRERLALRMKYYDQMTETAIARLFGMSRSGIRKVIDRARQHVGERLRKEEWL